MVYSLGLNFVVETNDDGPILTIPNYEEDIDDSDIDPDYDPIKGLEELSDDEDPEEDASKERCGSE